MFDVKQLFSLKNLVFSLFLAFIVSIPFQTRIVYFTQESHLGSDFLFYNTLFIYLSDTLLAILAIVWFAGVSLGKFHIKRLRQSEYLLWFLLFAIGSVIVSHETDFSIQIFGLIKLFLSILVLIFVIHIFYQDAKTSYFQFHVKHAFLWLILAISVAQGVIGVYQYFVQHSLGLPYLGEEFLRTYIPGVAKFEIPGAQKWIFDRLFNVSYGTNLVMRPYGTFSHPNVFGAFMYFSSLISLYLLRVSRETWKKIIIVSLLSFQIFCGFLSFSRVAVVAWCIAIVIWLVLNGFKKSTEQTNQLFVKKEEPITIQRIILMLVIISGISVFLLFPQYLDRGGVASYGTTNQESISDRALYQKIAWEMIKQKPFFGVGYQNFVLAMDNYSSVLLENHQHQPVHNIYLLIAAETGVPGLALFLLFVFYVLKQGWKNRKNIFVATFLSLFVMLLVVGIFDHYPITIQQGRLMFFLSAGIILAFSKEEIKKTEQILHENQQFLPINT